MQRVDGYDFLNISGIDSFICFIEGHIFCSHNEKYIKLAHVMIYLEIVDFGVSKSQAANGNPKPHLSQVMKINNWSTAFNLVGRPLLTPLLGVFSSGDCLSPDS